jgi:hypothetical protein
MIGKLKELKGEFPGESLEILDELFCGGFFAHGLSLGIDPFHLPGIGKWEKRWNLAIKREENRRAELRMRQIYKDLSRGKTREYDTPFKSDSHPYELRRRKEAIARGEFLAHAGNVKRGQ